jgi:WD40 repeat protein
MTTRNPRRLCSSFMIALALCLPSLLDADSSAYVTLSNAPGSITAFNPIQGSLGTSFFVPLGGSLMAIAPGTKQIWEVAAPAAQAVSIYVLDPSSGSTLANIPVNVHPTAMIMDAAGTYAYLAGANGVLVKIAVSSRRIVQEVSLGSATSSAGCMALSGDGSKLFVAAGESSVFVLDPGSLTTLATISIPAGFTGASSILVSGNTLLVTDQAQLLYFDATTFQQTNSATVPETSFLFGVSPDASRIYLYSDCLCGTANTISVLDFPTGKTLVSQTFSNVDLANVLLSPDGTQILVASNPVLLVDPNSLATTKTVWSMGIPNAAAYLNANTVFMLNYAPSSGGAMAVIDQSTAAVTAIFPLGMTPLSGLVADPARDLIYAGAYYYQDGSPNVVSTKLNRIVANLPVTGGFSPAALMGGQLYGTTNSAAAFFNLATGASGFLPSALDLGSAYFVDVGLGFAPPNGRTYWAPFYVTEVGGDVAGSGQPALSFASTRIAIYSSTTNSVVARLAPPGRVGPIVFSPDSSTAYIAGNNVIAVYSTQTLQNTATYKYATTFPALAIAVDGSVLYASDGNAVYVLDASTGAQNQVFSLPSPASSPTMALSPDGSTLFLTNDNGHAVDLIATATGQVTVVPVSFNPTGVVVVPSN